MCALWLLTARPGLQHLLLLEVVQELFFIILHTVWSLHKVCMNQGFAWHELNCRQTYIDRSESRPSPVQQCQVGKVIVRFSHLTDLHMKPVCLCTSNIMPVVLSLYLNICLWVLNQNYRQIDKPNLAGFGFQGQPPMNKTEIGNKICCGKGDLAVDFGLVCSCKQS